MHETTGSQPMAPRRRRNLPAPAIALRYDPALLLQRPPTPRAGRHHFHPRNLRHSRMIGHTTMSQPPMTS